MTQRSVLINHIALLVPSVLRAATALKDHDFPIGPPEEWDGEGTLEIYAGGESCFSRLLLMEPIKDGAYKRAMEKRGPGLHHIAIDVLNLEEFIESVSQSGWLLHPKSLHTIKKTKTAYLARPGTPMLIEVQEREEILTKPKFINSIKMPLSERNLEMLKSIGVDGIEDSKCADSWIEIGAVRITFETLGATKQG